MHPVRRWARACLLTAAATAMASATAAAATAAPALAAPADVPTPTITGPIPVTPTSHTFLATDQDLAKYGYVEEEFFVSGDAATYSPTNTLATATKVTTGGPNGDGTYPYKTRIVVRRPATAANFNGTTLLEWDNVTAGFDIEWNWLNDPDYLMRHGYAWVGVSAQAAGVSAGVLPLKAWNPTRYGDLDVSSTAGPGDPLSYDIYGSVAKALRGSHAGPDPLGGLTTQRIVATGESQSGSRLNVYYNAINPLHELVDAFLITVAGGRTSATPGANPGTLRTDRPQDKAIRVLSDNENLAGPTVDPDTPAYRRWDVAGGSHLPYKAYTTFAPVVGREIPVPLTADCKLPALSRVAWPYVFNRALEALVTWESGGTAPPEAPRFEFDGTQIRRDDHGITRGGIRLPEVEVPTATNSGFNEKQAGATSLFSAFCGLLGSSVPFAQEKLDALYGDYGRYVDAVAPKTQAVRDAGFITADDVDKVNADLARFARLRPETPKLAPGTTSTTSGTFAFSWRGPEPLSTATTYEVQRRSGAPGAAFETIPGAGALQARTLTRAPEAEGTYSYRVRSTTVVPPLYPDPQRVETTAWSGELTGVKVDRSVPTPALAPDRRAEYEARGGWWKGSVRVTVAATDTLPDGTPGVGLDPRSIPAPVTLTKTQRVTATVRDVAGHTSPVGARTFQVDATAPTATLGCPGGAIVVGTQRSLSLRAKDTGSGLAPNTPKRVKVSTRTAGRRTVTKTVRDRVGNRRTARCAVRIVRKPATRCTARRGTVRCAITLRPGIRKVALRLSRGGRTVARRTVRRSGTVTLTRSAAKGRYAVTVKVDGAVVQRRRVTA